MQPRRPRLGTPGMVCRRAAHRLRVFHEQRRRGLYAPEPHAGSGRGRQRPGVGRRPRLAHRPLCRQWLRPECGPHRCLLRLLQSHGRAGPTRVTADSGQACRRFPPAHPMKMVRGPHPAGRASWERQSPDWHLRQCGSSAGPCFRRRAGVIPGRRGLPASRPRRVPARDPNLDARQECKTGVSFGKREAGSTPSVVPVPLWCQEPALISSRLVWDIGSSVLTESLCHRL